MTARPATKAGMILAALALMMTTFHVVGAQPALAVSAIPVADPVQFGMTQVMHVDVGNVSFPAPLVSQLPGARGNLDRVEMLDQGDLNADGIVDLAVLRHDSTNGSTLTSLVPLLGVGDGTFSPTAEIVLATPRNIDGGVVIGDFTADGIPDLASVVDSSPEVLIHPGVGDGTFGASTAYAVPVPVGATRSGPHLLRSADLEGDGDVDLVVAFTEGLAVLRADGAGGFAAPEAVTTNVRFVNDVVAADLNGDGLMDFAIPGLDALQVLVQASAGTFAETTRLAIPNSNFTAAVAGEFTGDGTLDLVVARRHNNEAAVVAGSGDGIFVAPDSAAWIVLPDGWGAWRGSDEHLASDLDGDGHDDALFAVRGAVVGLFGDSAGGLTARAWLPSTPAADHGDSFTGAQTTTHVIAADANGDGRPDLIIGADGGIFASVNVALAHPDATRQWSTAPTYRFLSDYDDGHSVVLAEFTGDEHLDMLAVNSFPEPGLWVTPGLGDGTFGAPYRASDDGTCYFGYQDATGDFNGDGNADFVCHADVPLVFFGDGLGGVAGKQLVRLGDPDAEFHLTTDVQAVDMDGTGGDELAVMANVSSFGVAGLRRVAQVGEDRTDVQVWRWDPTEDALVLQSAVPLEAHAAPYKDWTNGLVGGDFDGDGNGDLSTWFTPASGGDAQRLVIPGDGDAGLGAPTSTGTGLPHEDYLASRTADLDGDGALDIVSVTTAGGARAVVIELGAGDGTFALPVVATATTDEGGGDFTGLAVADIDQDGALDVIVDGHRTIEVHRGDEFGGLLPPVHLQRSASYGASINVGDVDGDGRPDIVGDAGRAGAVAHVSGAEEAPPTIPNLEVISIDAPTRVRAGDDASVTVTVQNTGTGTALGQWRDRVRMETSRGPIDIGSVLVSGPLQPGEIVTRTITGAWPATLAGPTELSSSTDVGGVVAESDEDDNTTTVVVTAAVDDLAYDTTVGGTVAAGRQRLHRIDVTGGAAILQVTGTAAVRMATALNAVPADDQLTAVAAETVLATGVHHVLLSGTSSAGGGTPYTLRVSSLAPDVQSVAPSLATRGPVSFAITGAGFQTDAAVELRGGDATVPATKVRRINSTRLIATVDLTAADLGSYDVAVTTGGAEYVLAGGVEVVDGEGARFEVFVSVPDRARLFRTSRVEVTVLNAGGTDALVPVVRLSADRARLGREPDGAFRTRSIDLLAVADDGSQILAPGESAHLTARFDPDPDVGNDDAMNFTARAYGVANTTPWIWADAEVRLRPEGVPDDVWPQAFASLLDEVGDTAGSYALSLHAIHAELDGLGLASDHADDLLPRLIARAVTDVPGAELFGTVADAAGPLVEREILAVDPAGEIVQTTTTIDGEFAFHGLTPGGYDVLVRDAVPTPAGFANVPRTAPMALVVGAPVVLSGRVFTADGRGAGRIPVTVERVRKGTGAGTTFTDSAGRYTIRDVEPGELRIVARVPGRLPTAHVVTASAAGPYSVPDLVAQAGLVIEGTVTGPDAQPAEGAQVVIQAADGSTTAAAVAQGDGSWEASGLPAGQVEVTAFLEGVGQASTSVELPGPGGSVDLVLDAGGSVVGTVTSSAGGVIEGAVILTDALRTDELRTGVDGSYRADGLPGGSTLVEVRAAGHVPTAVPVVVIDGVDTTVDVELPTLGALQVTVEDGGAPLADVPVTAVLIGGLGGTVRTGGDGVALLEGLVPGAYVVHAGTTFGPDGTRAVVDVDSGTTAVTLGATTTAVTGDVVDDGGAPVAGARVAAVVDGQPLLSTVTDAGGSYELRLMPGVTVNLRAIAPDGSVAGVRDVVVGTTPLDVPLTTGAAGLQVTTSGPAGPAVDAEVVLRMDGLGEVARERTSAAGTVNFSGLPDGDWSLLATAQGLSPTTAAGSLPGAGSVAVALAAGRIASGRVLDAGGDPVAGALIGTTDPATSETLLTSTDALGRWTLTSLPPAPLTLSASNGADIVEAGIDVTAGSVSGVDLVLDEAGAAVEGVVTDAAGTPLLGRIVQLVRDGLPIGQTTTGSDGAYDVPGVPEGEWELLVVFGGAPSVPVAVDVPATGQVQVDVVAEPAIGWDLQPPFELGPPDAVAGFNASIDEATGGSFASPFGPGPLQQPQSMAVALGFGEVVTGIPRPQQNTWAANNKLKWRETRSVANDSDCPQSVISLEFELQRSESALIDAFYDLQKSYGSVQQVYTAGMGEALASGAYTGLKTWVTLSSIAGGGTKTVGSGTAFGTRFTVVQTNQAANALAGIGLPAIDTIAGATGNALFLNDSSLSTGDGVSTVAGVVGGISGLAGADKTSGALGLAGTAYDWAKFKDSLDNINESQLNTLISYSLTEDRYLAAALRHQQLTNTYATAVSNCDKNPPEEDPEDEDGPEDDEPGGGGGGEDDPPEPPVEDPGDDRPTKPRGPDGRGEDTSRGGQSADPNEIVGPAGVGEPGWIAAPADLGYAISFENQPDATLPATIVTITTQLDVDVDASTFELGDVGWGDVIVAVPDGRQQWTGRVPLSGSDNVVDVVAGLDVGTRVVTWTLTTIDPAIDDIPDDAEAGFLPPNDATHRGEGFVEYSVGPASTSTGTEITAQADIVFDANAAIVTNEWRNTIDNSRPLAELVALPVESPAPVVSLEWSAADVGSGAVTFDLFASVDGSPLFLYRDDVSGTTADVPVEIGKTYGFAVIATDAVGLQEAVLAGAETTTTVIDGEVDPPDPGPRTRLQGVIDELEALRSAAGKKDAKRLDKAIKELRSAEGRSAWDDRGTEDPDDDRLTRDGKKVFDDIRKAVKELGKVDDVDVGDAISELVAIANELSADALATAQVAYTAAGCNANSCAKAARELARAVRHLQRAVEAAEDDPVRAIHEHRKAFERAWKAYKALPG